MCVVSLVADLLPHTQYNVSVTACTEVACTNSSLVATTMPEAAPGGEHNHTHSYSLMVLFCLKL